MDTYYDVLDVHSWGYLYVLCFGIFDDAGPLYGIEEFRGELRTKFLVSESGFVIFCHKIYIGRAFSACFRTELYTYTLVK